MIIIYIIFGYIVASYIIGSIVFRNTVRTTAYAEPWNDMFRWASPITVPLYVYAILKGCFK